ncbi:MAG: Na+-transporting NADH:ubiquinone oxidoreductase, subunit NqrB [Bacteroidetes bacterium]|nr:Na+-transporting NADH:ubiquinone oxidoreductase, subunit NqrB [Bacteroidota bacterium]
MTLRIPTSIRSISLRDPRIFQIIFLGCFLVFGIGFLGWKAEWKNYLAIFLAAGFTQFIWIKITGIGFSSFKSSLITTLGLCLLLKSGNPIYLALAAALAISSKFLIRVNGKHLFNPGNFGIVVSILLTHQTWISPGQWGSDIILLIFFGAAGLMMLFRISRLETGITFLLVYFILLVARNVWYLGWDMEVVWHKFTNGSLLLFAFFMITDPMTIPNHRIGRIIWSAVVAIISFYLSANNYIHTAAIWVLFFASPVSVLIDKILPAIKYQWIKNPAKPNLIN